MKRLITLVHAHCCVLLVFSFSPAAEFNSFFTPEISDTYVYDISSDGKVVVGEAFYRGGGEFAFRWTKENGVEPLRHDGARIDYSIAYGVNHNGTVVSGLARNADTLVFEAFRWEDGDGITDRSQSPGINLNAYWAYDELPLPFPNQEESYRFSISDVSDNGTTAVGFFRMDESSDTSVFRWTAENGFVVIPEIEPGSTITAVSADGEFVVGAQPEGQTAYRWSESTGIVDIPLFQATGVSNDGKTVVGEYLVRRSSNAGIWFEDSGPVLLMDFAQNELGIDLAATTLENVSGISADGFQVAGGAAAPQSGIFAYHLDIRRVPEPSSFLLMSLSALLGVACYRRRWTSHGASHA